VLMAKGAYLLGERRRLLLKLGEEAFARLKSEDWKAADLEQLVRQLERVSKKIEIEEKLIQEERFGDRAPARDAEDAPEPAPEAPEPKNKNGEKGKSK